jgi:lipid II:glycine glycyltransferase (peptidoglycan interpeptide bridge formation enzyme)
MSTHPMQTKTWATFREATGVKVIHGSSFFMTLHPIPKTSYTIGYLPKGAMPNQKLIAELQTIGKREQCVFIQLEPNVKTTPQLRADTLALGLVPSAHPLFTKYTFILDVTESEEELLKHMHPKTRYNIRVAQKKGVTIKENNSDDAFETFLKRNHETNLRQKFYSHPDSYFRKLRELATQKDRDFSYHLLTAVYERKILTTWILFVCGDTLYYPYGASSSEHREVMANNLIMWEAIRFARHKGLKQFDMWGALGPHPDPQDPWFGFHRFKAGYGAEHVEFVGSFDLVIHPMLYQLFKVADKVRWLYLRLRR